MTNFEKIKSMNIDELAEKLNDSFACDRCLIMEFCDETTWGTHLSCTDVWKEWLKSEAKENEL